MFCGIVEETAIVRTIIREGDNIHFTLSCSFVSELKVDQSLSHNGVCLTIVDVKKDTYTVTAIKETLLKSNLGLLVEGSRVNIERSMKPDARINGHFVQGHVDQTAICSKIEEANGSWYFTFEYTPLQDDYITVEKGSVCVNGVSLTVVNSQDRSFQVAIIPYTYTITNFSDIRPGTVVNLEFDMIGKYITRIVRTQLGNRG